MTRNPKAGAQRKTRLPDRELRRGQAKPPMVDVGVKFVRDLSAKATRELGKPVDKAFRDSLYEND